MKLLVYSIYPSPNTELAKKVCPIGCVISPLRQQAESHNPGQTFLVNSVCPLTVNLDHL